MRENYRLYKLYKMVQKGGNNNPTEDNIDENQILGLMPIKKLRFEQDQTELVNYYLKLLENFKDISDIPDISIIYGQRERRVSNRLPETCTITLFGARVFPLSVQVEEHGLSALYFDKRYTQVFIQLDNITGYGLTKAFCRANNLTQEELLAMEGWYDSFNLEPYTGPFEVNELLIRAIIVSSADAILTGHKAGVGKQFLNLQEIPFKIHIEKFTDGEEEIALLKYLSEYEFLQDATANSYQILSGATAYVGQTRITGSIQCTSPNQAYSRKSVTVEDRGYNYLYITTEPITEIVHALKKDAYFATSITFEQIVKAIGLTPEKITKGVTVLGIEGTGESVESQEKIAELEAEIAEANAIIDQLNGEEV